MGANVSAREALERLGVEGPSKRLSIVLAVTAGASVGLGAVVASRTSIADGFGAAAAGLAIVAVWFGYHQWRTARFEISMDQYYARLAATDALVDRWPGAHSMLRHFWSDLERTTFERENYVYVELDNLEYAIAKYQLGYMHADHALRAVRTFSSRCASPEFRGLLRAQVDRLEAAGYQSATTTAVRKILAHGPSIFGWSDDVELPAEHVNTIVAPSPSENHTAIAPG
jgi:hypothetical protein